MLMTVVIKCHSVIRNLLRIDEAFCWFFLLLYLVLGVEPSGAQVTYQHHGVVVVLNPRMTLDFMSDIKSS